MAAEIWNGRAVERNFGALANSLLEQTKPAEREGVTKALHRLAGSHPEEDEVSEFSGKLCRFFTP